jgi:PAS domain S-box-containing protein
LLSHILDPANYSFSIYSIPTLAAMTGVLLLGLFVLVRERISTVSVAFTLVTLVVGIWLFCFSVVYSSGDEQTALWWGKAAYLGVSFIAPATYQFTVVVLHMYRYPLYRWLVLVGWVVSGLFAWVAIFTDLLVSGVQRFWWGYYTRYGPLGLPFILFFGALLVASMAHYWYVYRSMPPGRRKQRVRSLMLAFAIGYPGVVDFVATYGIPLYPFGYLPILGFVLAAGRAIWVYRLVDITPAFAARQIIDTMTDALLVLDRDGLIQLVNREACRLFDYSKEELVGRPLSALISDTELLSRLRGEGAGESEGEGEGESKDEGGYRREFELTYRTRHGGERTISISACVMREGAGKGRGNGEPVAVVCVLRDVTERKQAEQAIRHLTDTLEQRVAERTAQLQAANEELEKEITERRRAEQEVARLLALEQQARAQAEELARSREVMLSVVSHDLRNPLSVIKTSMLILRRADIPVSGEQAGRLEASIARIEIAADRMDRLIEELLDFAQLQAGQPLELHRRRTDLVELAGRVVEYHRQTTTRHTIRLECAVPELAGMWDPARLERVVDNLLANAIKYSPGGGEITVWVGRGEHCAGRNSGPCAVLVVCDQGIGIPTGELPHIFDWFRRARNVSDRIGGAGIGLASVLQAVEQHGGTIAVCSEEGVGTAFTVSLPLNASEAQGLRER